MTGRRTGAISAGVARAPLFPAGPVFVLLALAGVLWADMLNPEEGLPGLVATLGILALGAGYYLVAVRGSLWAQEA